ncbi:MAG: methyl-accepting chemotaxis protein [Natronomonas sp.]
MTMTSDPNATTDPSNDSTDLTAVNGDADPSDGGGAISPDPLTIELPDGTESVSEAILSNRQMLLDPDESAMASETEVVELTDWVEELAGNIEDVEQHQTETIEADVTDLKTVVKNQRRQIEELRGAIESLADILGTTADWETFDE